jgi:hypothetical protein
MAKHTLTFSTDNDYTRLELMFRELQEMLKRENKRIHSYDFQYEEVLNDVIDKMDEYINYEPSDAELMGEPPISAAERHSAAWAQHLELHR